MSRSKFGRNLTQFIQFCLVGGSGVVVNLIVAFIMTKLHGGVSRDGDVIFSLGSQPVRFTLLVWIVAFIVANTWNYQLNRSWTFRTTAHRSWWAEFWPFFFVGLVAAVVGIFIKHALTSPGSMFYLPEGLFNDHQGLRARAYWSQLFTIIITMPINYIVNKVWTFRGKSGAVLPVRRETVLAGAPDRPVDSLEMDTDPIDPDAGTGAR